MILMGSIAIAFLLGSVIALAHWRIYAVSSGQIHWEVQKLTPPTTVLVLGCPRLRPDGRINKYYQYRLDAALRLHQAYPLARIVLSDNSPEWMLNDLAAMGVPTSSMELDPKGLTTIDSVRQLEARYPSKAHAWVIVSQPNHLARTLYLTQHWQLPAQGYAAGDVHGIHRTKNTIRESLARVKALLNLHVRRVSLH